MARKIYIFQNGIRTEGKKETKGKEDHYIRADARHENIQTVVVSGISKERGVNDSARQLRGYME